MINLSNMVLPAPDARQDDNPCPLFRIRSGLQSAESREEEIGEKVLILRFPEG
jgi:hypothetical protein